MNRNILKRRFKGFTEPWKQRKLGEVAVVNSGKDYKHLEVGEIPVYGTGGYMISVNKALSYKNDAIGIGRKGTIDNPFILRAPFWTVDTLFFIFPKGMYELYFLYNIFEKINWNSKDESSGIPSLSKKIIEDTIYFFPTIEEQKLIGSFFKNLDEQIDKQGKKVEKLKNLKNAYLSEMFPAEGELSPKRRFKGFTKLWEEKKFFDALKKIIDFRGRTPKKLGMEWSTEGYLALSAQNVKNGYIDKEIEANYGNQELYDRWMMNHHLKKGDVLFTTEAPMGNVAQVPDNNRYILSQRTICFITNSNELIDDFLAVLLRTSKILKKLESFASGGTAKGVSQGTLDKLYISIPSLPEQKLIGAFFKKLDDEINLEQKKLEKLKQLKQAYLEEMFV